MLDGSFSQCYFHLNVLEGVLVPLALCILQQVS